VDFSGRRGKTGLGSILAGVIVAAALAAPAAAQLPPDNSAVDEYTENVPGAGGDKPSQDVGGGSGGGAAGGGGSSDGGSGGSDSGGALPADTSSELEQAGAQGAAAADLAQATAPNDKQPRDAGKAGGSSGKDDAAVGSTAGDRGSQGITPAASSSGDDDGGIGIGLPIALVAIAAAGAAVLVLRRRVGEPHGV
jgi:hypothetical protein